MRALSAALIGAIVVLVCTTIGLLFRIWALRRTFDMAARSPVLLICAGFAMLVLAVLVLLHWFLFLEGRGLGLPCYATFAGTYFYYGFGVIPYILRAVRIVVLYHSSYRHKYAGIVKWRSLRKAWASASLSVVVFAAGAFAVSARRYRNDYGCPFFEDTLVLGVTSSIAAPGVAFLAFKLSQVDDTFKLRREFTRVVFLSVPVATLSMLIQILYQTGAITESRGLHLIMETTGLAAQLSSLFWTVLVTVEMHDGWGWREISRIVRGIVPTEAYLITVQPKSSGDPTHDGVLAYVEEDGQVACMFEHFCERNLCAENWDFIVAACKYEGVSGVEEQFNTFVSITEEHLKPTSPQEVNISSRMQAKIASLQDKETFSALNGDSRRNVLQEALKEIVHMLEQNLLEKFKQTTEMTKWREDVQLHNLLLDQGDSTTEGDDNMRDQLLRRIISIFSSQFMPKDAV